MVSPYYKIQVKQSALINLKSFSIVDSFALNSRSGIATIVHLHYHYLYNKIAFIINFTGI